MGEDNEEEDFKCSRKKKLKLFLKVDFKEDGEERDDELVSIFFTIIREYGVFFKCSIAVKGVGFVFFYVIFSVDFVIFCIIISKLNVFFFVCYCRYGIMGILNNSIFFLG